jgi:NADH-quinone oxidoreductase subunit G
MANEDLGAVRRLMDALGGGEGVFRVETGDEVVLPGFPQLALREDRAANVRGAELFGFTRAGDGRGKGGLEARRPHRALLVLGDELADAPADFGRGAALFIYVGQLPGPAARNAHFVLPATTFAEMEGSFTNVQRRVQRFWPALQVPGMARPAWQILGVLRAGISGTATRPAPRGRLRGARRAAAEFGRLRWRSWARRAPLPELEALQDAGTDAGRTGATPRQRRATRPRAFTDTRPHGA